MFAGRQGLHPHLDMCGWNREVDDDLHGVVAQQGIHRLRAKTMALGSGSGGLGSDVSQTPDIQYWKSGCGLEIGIADVAAANDADTDFVHAERPYPAGFWK